MSIFKIVGWFLSFHFSSSYFVVNNIDLLEVSNYYVTSSKVSSYVQNITRQLRHGSLTFRLALQLGIEHELTVKQRTLNVANSKTYFYLYKENVSIPLDTIQNAELVEGIVNTYPNSSYVTGFIQDVYFYGTVEIFERIYQIENLQTYPQLYSVYGNTTNNAIIYERINKFNNSENSESIHIQSSKKLLSKNLKRGYDENLLKYKSLIGDGKICTLFVLVDNSFLRKLHRNNMQSAVTQVLNTIEEANSIFRSTDFDNDGVPDNIGFFIKFFVILESERSPLNLLPKYSEKAINGRLYLAMFSQYLILNEVCLGVAFTAQTFQNGIIGISYTAEAADRHNFQLSVGGICDKLLRKQPRMNLNTLAISTRIENGHRIPQSTLDLSLAHELGHSFGSDHDYTRECKGYLMADRAPKDFDRKHYLFSRCSKRTILKTVISRGHCLEDYEGSYCGNGKVEEGEACDCGTIRDCKKFDSCCIPRGRTDSCQVNKELGFQCHPSQGLCCTNTCLFRDMSSFDLDCRNFQKFCPCQNKLSTCSCGINGKCTKDICSSKECTRLNLLECECIHKTSKTNCQTCCQYNHECLPSAVITDILISANESLIGKLKIETKTEEKSNKFGSYKMFCHGRNCIKLYFREVRLNGYCMLFGKVGICNIGNKCVIPKIKRIYPSLHFNKNETLKSGTDSYTYVIKLLIMAGSLLFNNKMFL